MPEAVCSPNDELQTENEAPTEKWTEAETEAKMELETQTEMDKVEQSEERLRGAPCDKKLAKQRETESSMPRGHREAQGVHEGAQSPQPKSTIKGGEQRWEERFYTPPPPGNHFRDCKCARIETEASIHHPLLAVVLVYRIDLPKRAERGGTRRSALLHTVAARRAARCRPS